MPRTVLHIDASARHEGSVTRELSALTVARLNADTVLYRDLASALPQIDETWVNANFTPADQRDALQRDTLTLSDQLVDELRRADAIVIGTPVYNFSVPTSLRAWIDQVARVGETFRYTSEGPQGLLTDKRAVVVIASGGTAVGSEIDFASGYLRHMLGFMGVTDVELIAADRIGVDAEVARKSASDAIAALAA